MSYSIADVLISHYRLLMILWMALADLIKFIFSRMPIYVFHAIYVREKCDDGFMLACNLTYNKFKDAWYGYLSLLDIDIDSGFACDICEDRPDILIMDATSLSFRKEFAHWRSFLNDVDKNSQDHIPRIRYANWSSEWSIYHVCKRFLLVFLNLHWLIQRALQHLVEDFHL